MGPAQRGSRSLDQHPPTAVDRRIEAPMKSKTGKYSMSGRTITIVTLVAVLAIAAAIISIVRLTGEIDKRSDVSYEQGYYDGAYRALEGTWDESRLSVIHASLLVSACSEVPSVPSCSMLESMRTALLEKEMPAKLEDGDISTFQMETMDLHGLSSTLSLNMRYVDRYQKSVEMTSLDEETIRAIDDAMRLARSAFMRMESAELRLMAEPENTAVRDAKDNLEEVLGKYQTPTPPSGWGIEEIEQAAAEISEASDSLSDAIDNS